MKVLLLAGSAESRALAKALEARAGTELITTLAGDARSGRMRGAFPVAERSGGFGGEAGFRAFLAAEQPDAIIDATHPYAECITARTARVAPELGLPLLVLMRPPWEPEPGDDWREISTPEEAPQHIPEGACVFLGTGRAGLERFACLEGRRIICRQLDAADGPFPFEGGEFLVNQPPFTAAEEARLFNRLGIDWLVVKNAGGQGSRAKLDAAHSLSLPVVMLKRPALPEGVPHVKTVEAALDWVAGL